MLNKVDLLSPPWLEVKVMYVRVSFCPPDGIPEALSMSLAPRSSDKQQLEVNSATISPSQDVSLSLRRDRMESAEVTYVTTDCLRALGSVRFHIRDDKDEPLVEGVFKVDSRTGKWIMECCVGAAAAVFCKNRNSAAVPSMEVSLIGCSGGSPLIITETVNLLSRKRGGNFHAMLDAISEDSDSDSSTSREEAKEESKLSRFITPEPSSFGEEMSWFNAGVRVGVGIGLGMCLGVGIGVGLLVRTYQATTSSFRRRLF